MKKLAEKELEQISGAGLKMPMSTDASKNSIENALHDAIEIIKKIIDGHHRKNH